MQSYFFTKQRWLNWSFATLLILFSLQVTAHQFDANLQHHENHHCQLFHSLSSGVTYHSVSISILPQLIITHDILPQKKVVRYAVTERARSPPTYI